MGDALSLALKTDETGIELSLHVQPNAAKTEICGIHGNRVKLRVKAKPVEGAANEAICKFFAKAFRLAKSQVRILRGETSREKTLRIEIGSDPEKIREIARVIRKQTEA
ncbi:MAG: DUF167 domain-containing protein [Candidatus Sumerlaeia bacterium]